MKKTFIPLFVGLLCWTSAQAATLTYSYDGGITAAQNGTALQAAINAASAGDELKVQAGTYIGNFSMREGVNVSGGWNEGFTAQTDYATVLDAQSNGRVLNQSENYNTLTVWSNMTIQNGRFTAQQTDKAGAGVFLCDKGQVKHCLIQNNLFDAASGEASGGGVYENGYTTSVLVDDCIIRGNTASHGGGVRICGVIQNSIIEGNTTTINACGGVQLHYGGAMYNCIVRNNTGKDTGGVRLTGNKACTMANCLIVGNTATGSIGGVSLESGVHYVYNNTIVGNNQSANNATRCGVRLNVGGALKFCNNIVWGNKAGSTVQANQMELNSNYVSGQAANFNNNAVVLASDFGTNTTILTTSDPGFVDAANGDYSLLSTSAMVDAGNNTYAQGLIDLAGNARISGATVDLGCYEYQYPVIADNYVHSDEDLQEAIDATAAGTTVYVQAGTYVGNFTMKEGVNVSGGWNADFTAQTDYASILDANADGRVLEQPSNFTTLTVWSNFTIQNGNLKAIRSVPANGLSSGVALGKKGQVKHCLIQNNTFSYNGNCMGGGVGNDAIDAATDVCAEDCIIRNNCGTHGGGVRVRGTVLNCIIENNNTNNSIKTGPGGGVHLQSGRLVGCIVKDNYSGGDTGGVRLFGKCQLINCLVVGNTATGKVGGVGVESANSDIIGCTIVDNDQLSSNAGDNTRCGISCGATSDNGTKLANNIVWGNKHNGVVQTAQIYYISHYAAANRVYNAIAHQNTTNGIKLSMSNDDDDTYLDGDQNEQTGRAPHFADPANGDYRLTWQSPMLGRANSSIAVVTKDLDGNNRNIEGVDLGAYELPYYTLTIAAFDHATLTVGGETKTAGDYSLPKGYTTTATIEPDENYSITSVTCGDAILTPEAGIYTLPALLTDMTLTITVQSTPTGIDDANTAVKAVKVIRNGQLLILRDGKEFNVLGSQL